MRQDGHVLCNAADEAQEQGQYTTLQLMAQKLVLATVRSTFGQISERLGTLPSMYGISRRPRLLLIQVQLTSGQDFEACTMDTCR